MDETNNLYVVQYDGEDGDCVCYVTAPGLAEAVQKWKNCVASHINEDYDGEGIERVITASEIDDPISIQLIAFPEELML